MWAMMPMFLVLETSVTASFAVHSGEDVLKEQLALINTTPSRD